MAGIADLTAEIEKELIPAAEITPNIEVNYGTLDGLDRDRCDMYDH